MKTQKILTINLLLRSVGENITQNSGVSTRLQYAALPIIKNTVCRQFWYQVTEKEVCTAPGLGRNACQVK